MQESSLDSLSKFEKLAYTLLPALLALRYLNAPPDSRTYGPSHWFLNYQHGFMRRSLVGQAFSHVHYLSWRSIFFVEAVVLICVVGLTYLVFRSLLLGDISERRLAAFLLAGPAFLPHMAFMGGELDSFLYVVLLLGAWGLIRLRNHAGLAIATVCTGIGLLIHEAFPVMFYPLLFALIVELVHRRRVKPLWAGLHLALIAACFLAIVKLSHVHGTAADWLTEAQLRTNMPLEPVVFTVLRNTFSAQVRFALGLYHPAMMCRLLITLVLSLPYGVVLWRLLHSTLSTRGYSQSVQRTVMVAFFLPLLLIPLGHDVLRWISALCINVSLYVLFLYIVDRDDPERRGAARSALLLWSANSANMATLVYLVALGPWALTGNRLFTSLEQLVHQTRAL